MPLKSIRGELPSCNSLMHEARPFASFGLSAWTLSYVTSEPHRHAQAQLGAGQAGVGSSGGSSPVIFPSWRLVPRAVNIGERGVGT